MTKKAEREEYFLANSIADYLQERLSEFDSLVTDRRSTDDLTWSRMMSQWTRTVDKGVKDLIADSGLDGRFRRGQN